MHINRKPATRAVLTSLAIVVAVCGNPALPAQAATGFLMINNEWLMHPHEGCHNYNSPLINAKILNNLKNHAIVSINSKHNCTGIITQHIYVDEMYVIPSVPSFMVGTPVN
ncbi:hypothetical protein [Nonomuraea longicatena]|uniref:Secreted protein n=1 Tax=Nonomuraea longicatena TaxID=83682 RepID=A0ABP4BPL5_9ACTN